MLRRVRIIVWYTTTTTTPCQITITNDSFITSRCCHKMPSVCLSVRLSVTRRYSFKTAQRIVKLFSPSGSHASFSLPNGMAIRRVPLNWGVECKGAWKKSWFSANISVYLGNDTIVTMALYCIISYHIMECEYETVPKLSNGTIFRDFERTLTQNSPSRNNKLIIDAEYLRNDTRYRHNYNGILKWTYTRPTQGCYFEWHRVT